MLKTTKYAYGRNGALAYERKSFETTKDKNYSRTFVYLNDQIIGFTDKALDDTKKTLYTVTDQTGSVTEVYAVTDDSVMPNRNLD